MNTKHILGVVLIVMILTAMAAVAVPAFAADGCSETPGMGWHIVNSENETWYSSESECLIALQVPTALATLQATMMVTEPSVTEEPTNIPTDPPTVVPTEFTPTARPTDWMPPTPTEVVPTKTPDYSQPQVPTPTKVARRGMSCQRAWHKITETLYEREVGFRFFENPNHRWCKTWLMKEHGIDWDIYKVMYPLGG